VEHSIAYCALRGRCPACGKGKLYSGFLTIAENCKSCGLELKKHEQGDGTAFFCICIVGTLTGIFAALVEVMYEPPFWLHASIWIPFIIIGSLLSMRVVKAALIAVQYNFRAQDFSE